VKSSATQSFFKSIEHNTTTKIIAVFWNKLKEMKVVRILVQNTNIVDFIDIQSLMKVKGTPRLHNHLDFINGFHGLSSGFLCLRAIQFM
jgi:hypothetical protein